MVFYYIVTYIQLFGYGFWGTLWREIFIMFAVLYIQYAFIIAIFGFDTSLLGSFQVAAEDKEIYRFIIVALLVIAAAITMALGHVINLMATITVLKFLIKTTGLSRTSRPAVSALAGDLDPTFGHVARLV